MSKARRPEVLYFHKEDLKYLVAIRYEGGTPWTYTMGYEAVVDDFGNLILLDQLSEW